MKKMSRRLRDPKLWEIIHPDKWLIVCDKVGMQVSLHLPIRMRMLRPLTEIQKRVNRSPRRWHVRALAWMRSWWS